MIYFDNAATSYPKPQSVYRAASLASANAYGNPGRSGHTPSMRAARVLFETREALAEFFGAETENVAFTLNCTHALNLAVKGILEGGGHAITSSLEHNSVLRPLHALSLKGNARYDIARVENDDEATLQNFRAALRPDTKAVVCTLASNVTGQILPFREIGRLCAERGICFIADGAQACGILPVSLKDGINILCAAGHKGLFGLMGTGFLATDGKFPIKSTMEGGTGSNSKEVLQPDFMPDLLESGTPNTPGIASLGAGLAFVERYGLNKRLQHEQKLCTQLIEGLRRIPGVHAFPRGKGSYAPIVSFAFERIPSSSAASLLDQEGFALRGGFHCAGLVHEALGTEENGLVRFAPSVFNTPAQVSGLLAAVKKSAGR